MVTRNYGMQDIPSYSRLFQIGSGDNGAGDIEDNRVILTLDEVKPSHVTTQSIQQHEGAVYHNLTSVPEWVSAYTVIFRQIYLFILYFCFI
jgi:hypothetical protein